MVQGADGREWGVARLHDVPPVKADWPATWKSVRHHFAISGFGVNGVSKDAGGVLIPEHDETASGQEELFFVHEGEVEATLDGEAVRVPAGSIVAVGPAVRRTFKAAASPTTLLIVGSPPGKAYEMPEFER
jgi:mannose-6-phosphate isomerase-like protein (cupin superfamily)